MTYLTIEDFRLLPKGTRVAFPNGAEAYPSFRFAERLEGELVSVELDCAWILIDGHKPELDEWDNQIQVWFWDDGTLDMSVAVL